MLFNIFCSDLKPNIKLLLLKFVGDSKIGGVVNNGDDRVVIQSNLHHMVRWAHSNKMNVKTAKCKVIHLGLQACQVPWVSNQGP